MKTLEFSAAPTALTLFAMPTQAFRPGLKFGPGPSGLQDVEEPGVSVGQDSQGTTLVPKTSGLKARLIFSLLNDPCFVIARDGK
jgi:hypothetical protein